jgi:hypothetical protein
MQDLVNEKWIAEISQARDGWQVRTTISLSVLPRDVSIQKEVVATRFGQALAVSPRFTLEEVIRQGTFAKPLIGYMTEKEYRLLPSSRLISSLAYS